jgi:hypothetical protein
MSDKNTSNESLDLERRTAEAVEAMAEGHRGALRHLAALHLAKAEAIRERARLAGLQKARPPETRDPAAVSRSVAAREQIVVTAETWLGESLTTGASAPASVGDRDGQGVGGAQPANEASGDDEVDAPTRVADDAVPPATKEPRKGARRKSKTSAKKGSREG